MKDIIFREYDIRGIVDSQLYIDDIYDVTRAIIYYFHERKPDLKTIAVGMDGRIHSMAIKKEMCRAIIDSGINVLFLGVCPTPVLYFSLFTQPVDGGLMITASHNAKEYNGIKLCVGTQSVWGTELQTIKRLYKKSAAIKSSNRGTVRDYPIIPDYISWLVDHFAHVRKMDLKAVVDCGNGAAGTVLPDLISAMEWPNVSLLYPEVDGTYPNHEADPTIEKNMATVKQMLATRDIDLGIGLDGDCDRMAPMTKHGILVPGDQLLAIFAKQVVAKHPGCGVVFDIKSSATLIELLEKWGARPIMSPSGHSIIKNMMQEYDALLGGELSCHFFFKDRYFGYDDGIYAMIRLFEIIRAEQQSLTDLLTIFPHTFSSKELRIDCPEEKKLSIITALINYFNTMPNVSLITIDGIRVTFPFGWGIIRASNTQAKLSMRFEAGTQSDLKKVITIFYNALKPYIKAESLTVLTHSMETI